MGRLSIVTFYKYILKEKVNISTNEMINAIIANMRIPELDMAWGKVGYLPIQHASGLNPQYNIMLNNSKYIMLIRKYI